MPPFIQFPLLPGIEQWNPMNMHFLPPQFLMNPNVPNPMMMPPMFNPTMPMFNPFNPMNQVPAPGGFPDIMPAKDRSHPLLHHRRQRKFTYSKHPCHQHRYRQTLNPFSSSSTLTEPSSTANTASSRPRSSNVQVWIISSTCSCGNIKS